MKSDVPCSIEPLMTRDPAKITNLHAAGHDDLKGIYAKHHIDRIEPRHRLWSPPLWSCCFLPTAKSWV